MKSALSSRASILRVLDKVQDLHEPTANGCSCGRKTACPTQDLVYEPKVEQRIARQRLFDQDGEPWP
jgi:hypothetical protein